MPANIFFNTSIPTTVIILKKNRTNRDVLFIDASKNFDKGKNQNTMTDEHIQTILDAYIDRKDIDKYAHLATFDEIKENDYNLNIPRYVDTFEEEEPIDIVQVTQEITKLNSEIKQAEAEFLIMLDQLAITPETKDLIESTKGVFK